MAYGRPVDIKLAAAIIDEEVAHHSYTRSCDALTISMSRRADCSIYVDTTPNNTSGFTKLATLFIFKIVYVLLTRTVFRVTHHIPMTTDESRIHTHAQRRTAKKNGRKIDYHAKYWSIITPHFE